MRLTGAREGKNPKTGDPGLERAKKCAGNFVAAAPHERIEKLRMRPGISQRIACPKRSADVLKCCLEPVQCIFGCIFDEQPSDGRLESGSYLVDLIGFLWRYRSYENFFLRGAPD